MHEDEGDDATGPDARIPPRRLRPGRIGRHQGIGRVGQAVEVEAAADERGQPDGGDRREDRLRRRRRRARGMAASRPMPSPTSGKTAAPARGAAPAPHDPTGIRVSRPMAARRSSASSRSRRQPDERRVDPEDRPDPGIVERRGRRPVGDDPAVGHDQRRGRRSARPGPGRGARRGPSSRRARARSTSELHDLDLVADVEVGGRLVEDEDRGFLGEGEGDERELALAGRQRRARRDRAGLVMPTRSMAASMASRSAGASPVRGGSCGSRPSATTSSTVISNGHLRQLGDDRDGPRDVPSVASQDRLATQRDHAGAGLQDAGQAAQQRRLAGAVRPDDGRSGRRPRGRAPGTSRMRRPPASTCSPSAWMDGRMPVARSQLVPRARALQQEQEERRPEHGHDDPDRDVAGQPGQRGRPRPGAPRRRAPRAAGRGAPPGRRPAARHGARPARRSR